MKKFLCIFFFICIQTQVVFADNNDIPSYTLGQCYHLALKRSYELSNKLEVIQQAQARISQSFSSFLPTVDFNISHTRQEAATQYGALIIGNQSKQTTMNFSYSETLFDGFKSFAALKKSKLEKSAYEQALYKAKLQLYEDVANAFYNMLKFQRDVTNYTNEINAYMQRRDELIVLKQKGRARQTDVVAVKVSIANLEAQLSQTKGLLEVNQEMMAFLIGIDDEFLLVDNTNDELRAGDINAWTKNIDQIPTVEQSQYNLKAQRQELNVQRSGYFPTAQVSGNTYVERQGIQKGINWDLLFTLKMPLFTGGDTQAHVREAYHKLKQLEADFQETREESKRDVKSSYKTLLADLDQYQKLKDANDLGQQYYDLIVKDNAKGLSTNVDVLNALSDWHDKKRFLEDQRYVTQYDFVKLQVNAGLIDINE